MHVGTPKYLCDWNCVKLGGETKRNAFEKDNRTMHVQGSTELTAPAGRVICLMRQVSTYPLPLLFASAQPLITQPWICHAERMPEPERGG